MLLAPPVSQNVRPNMSSVTGVGLARKCRSERRCYYVGARLCLPCRTVGRLAGGTEGASADHLARGDLATVVRRASIALLSDPTILRGRQGQR